MKHVPVTHQAMDLTLGSRAFNACWLSAGFGLSTLQMLLLALAWRESQQALVSAILVSAWALGSLVGARCCASSRLWGYGCLACTLLCLGGPVLDGWRIPHILGLPTVMVDSSGLALLAALLGACGTAWLGQPRPWPAAGEKTSLVRHLVGLTVGLLVAWTLPAVGGLVALACCLPLLALDMFLSGRAPLPPVDGMAARWMDRYWRSGNWTIHLERGGLLPSWRGFFPIRGLSPVPRTLPLLLQASAVTLVLGSVWGAVPTPFAASLHATRSLDVLDWLLGGQLVALVVGTGFLLAARGAIGFPGRLLPRSWQSRMRRFTPLMPLAMAASLAALGLPALQGRWWLALSLACYTLADAVWTLLLPRLLPELAAVVPSQRYLLFGRDAGLADPLRLAHASACETRAKLLLARIEALAIVACTPLLGWLIDRLGSVDVVLVLVGLTFALGQLGVGLVGSLVAFTHRLVQPRQRLNQHNLRFSGRLFPRLETAPHR